MLKGPGRRGGEGVCAWVDDHQGGKERNGIMGTEHVMIVGLKIMDLGRSFWASYGGWMGGSVMGMGMDYGYYHVRSK
jgi:hypothetical protein